MGYKLIAMDMDGTLLNRDTKVSEGNAKALEDAMAAGNHVVLASGRMYVSVKPFFEAMGLNAPVITYQGARVMGTRGEELYRKCVPMELAGEILAYAREKNFYIQMYWDERLFYEERTNHTDYYEAKSGIKGTALGRGAFDHLEEEPFKILCMDSADRISEARRELAGRYAGKLQVATSEPEYLEITHHEAHKGAALAFLAESMGVPQSDVIAVGDGRNDISMIRWAGLGVAMENASASVKEAADVVAPANDEDGVAYIIRKYMLEQ